MPKGPSKRAMRKAALRRKGGKTRTRANSRRAKPGAAKLATSAEVAVFAGVLAYESPDPLIATNVEGVVLFWNRGAEMFFERGPDEAAGRSLPELLAINDAGRQTVVRAAIKRAIETGAANIEMLHERRSGRFSDIAITFRCVRDKGSGSRILAIHVRDASILRRLREERTRIRDILESAPDAMVIVGSGGRIEFVNKETERLFGYAPQELLNEPVEILVPERFRGRHPAHRARYFTVPKTRPMGDGFELYGLRKDGTEFPVEISLSPIEAEGGVSVVSAIRDVSDRKRAASALLEAKEAAETASREFEAFSYSVAHDLRAPLRGIDGFCHALLEDYSGKLDDEGKDHLQRLRAAAQHMAQLIDDLLMLARVTHSGLRRERVDLSVLARDACQRLRSAGNGREAEFVIADRITANGDGGLLRVVLDNLIGNAWKFTAKTRGGRIEFGRRREDGEDVYFVRDNGAGFDMAYADKLFGVFQRLHGPQEFKGTGIGLVTCERIIRRHGGRIWATAEVGKGAVFYFTLGGRGGKA